MSERLYFHSLSCGDIGSTDMARERSAKPHNNTIIVVNWNWPNRLVSQSSNSSQKTLRVGERPLGSVCWRPSPPLQLRGLRSTCFPTRLFVLSVSIHSNQSSKTKVACPLSSLKVFPAHRFPSVIAFVTQNSNRSDHANGGK